MAGDGIEIVVTEVNASYDEHDRLQTDVSFTAFQNGQAIELNKNDISWSLDASGNLQFHIDNTEIYATVDSQHISIRNYAVFYFPSNLDVNATVDDLGKLMKNSEQINFSAQVESVADIFNQLEQQGALEVGKSLVEDSGVEMEFGEVRDPNASPQTPAQENGRSLLER